MRREEGGKKEVRRIGGREGRRRRGRGSAVWSINYTARRVREMRDER